ncbi:hypothetical protein [Flavobacterium sp. AG291]|uniref:hypothetical protein n=1 Tax=Flavobacterium sp. AG291 TaxID=2184000 RepID=UPI000E0A7596|nr:hypothetical protein [Flavobacterium sp. AG291]RDI07038.1 hypothetical protein DEU42_113138 [Flavobacterium sp. AG291]
MKTLKNTWLLIFIGLILIASCGKPPLPTVKETDNTTQNTTVNTIATKEIDRNKAIADSLQVVIGKIRTSKKECDSVCQEAIDKILEQVNTNKVSGDNKYGVYYDKYRNLLIAYQNLAETKSEKNYVSRDSIVYIDKLKTKEIPVVVKFTPWYYKYPAYFGWACLLFFCGYLISKVRTWIRKKSLL